MVKRSTVLMILITTVLALGLTVYGESLNKVDKVEMVKKSTLNNYKNIHQELRD